VEVIIDGARTDLTRRELALLRFLVTHANRVLGRADLLNHVWRNENDGRSRTVDVHIRRLRMKLGAAAKQIETIPGLGYRFREE
jgi:DNA-binding response OmpR family regulator